jgi:hypothetical protein
MLAIGILDLIVESVDEKKMPPYLTGAAGQVVEVVDRVTLDALERSV